MMRLHGYWRSSAAYRCRIALNLKELPYEPVSVHLRRNGGEQRSPAFLALNPQGLVPALEADGQVLVQSMAIIEWLDERHPMPPLMPRDADLRARVRGFAQVIACDIHPLQNLRVLQYLRNELGHDQPVLDEWCKRWIKDGLAACEELLPRQGDDRPFCFGHAPTLADVCLAPQLYSAARFGVGLDGLSRLRRLEQHYAGQKAFVAAHPDSQPDSEI